MNCAIKQVYSSFKTKLGTCLITSILPAGAVNIVAHIFHYKHLTRHLSWHAGPFKKEVGGGRTIQQIICKSSKAIHRLECGGLSLVPDCIEPTKAVPDPVSLPLHRQGTEKGLGPLQAVQRHREDMRCRCGVFYRKPHAPYENRLAVLYIAFVLFPPI